ADRRRWFASEMKALVGICDDVAPFPPGHLLDSAEGRIRPYFAPAWRSYEAVRGVAAEPARIKSALQDAVRRQLMAEVPYGVLLSGGLDSSIVAWCAQQAAGQPLHSFAIGLAGAPDLEAAAFAAES